MTTSAQLEQTRFNMIEQQIRPWDVLEPAVLALLSVVKREQFVPAEYQAFTFVDMETPLPFGQSMLSPKVEARTLQDLKIQKHEKVLEIGTGSGYMAALLGYCAHSVLSLEILPELASLARNNLRAAGVHNVEVRHADGALGAAADGPFDVIVLSGSVASVPEKIKAQLKVGGRLFAVVGQQPMMCANFITRASEAAYTTTQPWDTVAPRLVNFPEPSKFSF
ncbi:protein-L-isoaspartate(D-aspartate) O-methyltransferase [Rhodoferax ferrireducens]|uniref:Protein-L-isoaspartate O-methyltransferase n=1 Tax=Rhodoferax ferrireducens TaxID=192843 RepID=A0ABU2C6K7_9BURK|nr:protein-L-isoaspartate O-methyltransferase [Rhodoferax ferrireducens]MDR7376950.1 protein-L-isoaspartate(D-aspartate) O-methyltransferase [Rhodoferax ferrireducens]